MPWKGFKPSRQGEEASWWAANPPRPACLWGLTGAARGVLAVLVAVSWALAGLLAVVLVVRGSPDRHAPCGGLSPLANPRWHKANLYLTHVYVCNERRFGGDDFETSHASRRQ